MEKTVDTQVLIAIRQAAPWLVRFPTSHFWLSYHKEVDVLYISFERPQRATDTHMTDDGLLLRYRGDRLVGVTILGASER